MLKRSLLSVFASVVILGLAGCNSSGGSNSGSSTDTSSISGKVADGYLVGAKVCLDKNINEVCDADEPFATSKAGGAYLISGLTATDTNLYPLLAEVGADAIDEDTNQTVGTAYKMVASPGEKFISPISTMVHRKYEEKLLANLDKTTALVQAKADVAQLFGIANDDISSDYVENGDDTTHTKAQLIVRLQQQLRTSLSGATSADAEKAFNSFIDRRIFDYKDIVVSNAQAVGVDLTSIANTFIASQDLSGSSAEIALILNEFKSLEDKYTTPVPTTTPGGDTSSTTPAPSDTVLELVDAERKKLVTALQVGQPYRYTYQGGTQFTSFEIADSVSKECALTFADTTAFTNTYSKGLQVNGSTYDQNIDVIKLVPSATENATVGFAWMYYTNVGGHADFTVACESVDMTVASKIATLNEQYGLLLPTTAKMYTLANYFFKTVSGSESLNMSTKRVAAFNSDNAFFALRIGNRTIGNLSGATVDQIDAISATFSNNTVTVTVYDIDKNILKSFTVDNVGLYYTAGSNYPYRTDPITIFAGHVSSDNYLKYVVDGNMPIYLKDDASLAQFVK